MPVELRASRLPLLMKCSGPAYLPTVEEPHEERDKANEWGHMVHKWKETGEIEGKTRAANALRKAIAESGIRRDLLWPPDGVHEQSVAVRIDGTRSVLSSHPTVPDELSKYITGTDDFHWFMLDGELWVDDLKTGKYYTDPETGSNRYPQDVNSPQLRLYALAISVLLEYAGVVHVSLTHWPRLPLDRRHSPPERFWTTYTHEELMEFWNDLEQLYSDTRNGLSGSFNLSPGDHCRFCPARSSCFVAQEFEPPRWPSR